MARALSLIVRNLAFTVVVPGLGGAWVPWWILTRHGRAATPTAWEAIAVIAAGAALYVWCVWNFAAVGRALPACGTHRRALSRPGHTVGCATRSTWPRS